jgi:uncharacterized protein with HEPN domain
MKDDRLYLIHIRECIARIVRYTADGGNAFLEDTKTQDAVIRNLQTLAESTQRVSEPLQVQHPEVEWRTIAAFRNVAVHDYLGIDLSQIWDIVADDLPKLDQQIASILHEVDNNA